nr:uncharacterized protein LOC126521852 isoform X2 [Dermacentor andersoni]
MLNNTLLKALLLVFFTALGSEVFCCKPFEAARGKRLLRLKANFIKIQNKCRRQIVATMKLLTRDDLKKLVEAFCNAHNDCMKSTAEESAVELLDCWSTAARNETGPFHASGAPHVFHQALGVPSEHRPHEAIIASDRRPNFIRDRVRRCHWLVV